MRNGLKVVMVVLCILSFMAVSNLYAAGMTVIGKANIKKGTELGGVAEVPGSDGAMTPFVFIAFEDCTIYIVEKVEPKEGVHPGGYLADASGFPHDCPHHGKEVMSGGMIGIPVTQIEAESDNIEIILLEQLKQ